MNFDWVVDLYARLMCIELKLHHGHYGSSMVMVKNKNMLALNGKPINGRCMRWRMKLEE